VTTNDIGAIPGRVYAYSALFHVAVAVMLYGLIHWHFFDRELEEETPMVVQLVNAAPETRATQVAKTPPKAEKPPEVAQVETPKPPELKPEPPPPPELKPEPPPPQSKPPPPVPPPQQEVVPPPPPPPEPKPQEAKVEPKPEPKPEPPKAPDRRPEPPKAPDRKPEPPKKKEEVMSDAFLKNLAKSSPTRTQEQAPKQVAAAPAKSSSQPIAPLGPQLTTSEMDLVKQQIEQCWSPPVGARDAQDLKSDFRVFMNADGTVRTATQLNAERNSDPFFRAAAESAMRALRNPTCQPLKLPPEKFDIWQTFTITFDPKDIK
jgi:hypothetical protein